MALLHLLLVTAWMVPMTALAQTLCNGRAEYCGRRYSEVSFVGAHNSPFVGMLLQHNQEISVTAQLDMGIRFLQGQTHEDVDGTLSMCHSSCILEDAGSLESFLATVKVWMDRNPTEVVTLLITNGDRLPMSRFDQAFASSGIKSYAFVPSTSPDWLPMASWPTLQELIDSGKRLIVFIDYSTDMAKFPYLLDEFTYYFETPFENTDPTFPQCKIDRPPGVSPDGYMYLVNHNLQIEFLGIYIPLRSEASKTNAVTGEGSIGAHFDLCSSTYERKPQVILLDFVNRGEVMKAQDMMNGFKGSALRSSKRPLLSDRSSKRPLLSDRKMRAKSF